MQPLSLYTIADSPESATVTVHGLAIHSSLKRVKKSKLAVIIINYLFTAKYTPPINTLATELLTK